MGRRTDYDSPALHAAAKTAATANPADIPDLVALLHSEHSKIRFWSVVGLANLGSDGNEVAIPEALHRTLEDPNGEVAVAAAEATDRFIQTSMSSKDSFGVPWGRSPDFSYFRSGEGLDLKSFRDINR